jgi:predicted membrane protein
MPIGLSDTIGMAGTALVVLAYFLLQLERVDPRSLTYNLVNLVGAMLLLISLCFTFNLASFVIEIFWIAASLIGLWKLLQRRRGNISPDSG